MNRLSRNLPVLVLPLLLIFSCACNKQPAKGGYQIEHLALSPSSLDMVVGDRAELTAHPSPSVANALTFAWESSDAAVATVNGGIVTAIAPGTAQIMVSYQGTSASAQVTIREKTPVDPITPDTDKAGRAVMYSVTLSEADMPAEIETNGQGSYTAEGLLIDKTDGTVKLNRFYALAERAVRYRIVPSKDAVCLMRSSEGDFAATLNLTTKEITINTTPAITAVAPFLEGEREYEVEIKHVYQSQTVSVTDIESGQTASVTAVNDGEGGCGQGKINDGFYVGPGWDHYCFGLQSGRYMLVKTITVESLKDKVKLLLYGDSITQPECYYPTSDFGEAYTQLMIEHLKGEAMSSGRGGCTINTVLEYIVNELPYIKAEYVMVTIGTNGGNTTNNLSQLVEYIRSRGATPILNNMPCNESGTQCNSEFGGNPVIAQVREKYGIRGARLDIATSLDGDGKAVDKSKMYWEDYSNYPAPYTGWQIYHHPNPKGGRAMFEQIVQDLPELFD